MVCELSLKIFDILLNSLRGCGQSWRSVSFSFAVWVQNSISEVSSDLNIVDSESITANEFSLVQSLFEELHVILELLSPPLFVDWSHLLRWSSVELDLHLLDEILNPHISGRLTVVSEQRVFRDHLVLFGEVVHDGARLSGFCAIRELNHWNLSELELSWLLLHFLELLECHSVIIELNSGLDQ